MDYTSVIKNLKAVGARLGLDQSTTEDLIQDTFLIMLQKKGKFSEENPIGLSQRIFSFKYKNWCRSRRSEVSIVSKYQQYKQRYLGNLEDRAAVLEGLNELPEDQRKYLSQYLDGVSPPEIHTSMKLKHSRAYALRNAAMKNLKRCLVND
jgi:DNA-directed RNA polymerase specialized sigma24 family protein